MIWLIRVSFNLSHYKSVSSGLSTCGKLIKPAFLDLQKLRRQWPRQGASLPQVSFAAGYSLTCQRQGRGSQGQPEPLKRETRVPGQLFSSECCSWVCRLLGTRQLISLQQTQRPTRHGAWRDTVTLNHCQARRWTCVRFKEGSPPAGWVPLMGSENPDTEKYFSLPTNWKWWNWGSAWEVHICCRIVYIIMSGHCPNSRIV